MVRSLADGQKDRQTCQANVAIDLKRDWLSSPSPVCVAWRPPDGGTNSSGNRLFAAGAHLAARGTVTQKATNQKFCLRRSLACGREGISKPTRKLTCGLSASSPRFSISVHCDLGYRGRGRITIKQSFRFGSCGGVLNSRTGCTKYRDLSVPH